MVGNANSGCIIRAIETLTLSVFGSLPENCIVVYTNSIEYVVQQ